MVNKDLNRKQYRFLKNEIRTFEKLIIDAKLHQKQDTQVRCREILSFLYSITYNHPRKTHINDIFIDVEQIQFKIKDLEGLI